MSRGTINGGAAGPDLWVEQWMRWIAMRPLLALSVLGCLVVLSAFSALRLGVDADSSRMLSPDLPAQERALALNEAFPSLKRTIVVLVEGQTADEADLAVSFLLNKLRTETDHIETAYAVSADPFFTAHGFLYRELDAVDAIFARISKSANLIAQLRADQSIAGFATAMMDAAELAERADISADALARLYSEAAVVIEASAVGERRLFGWSTVMDDAAVPGPALRLINVTPKLDPNRLSPARPALDEIHAAVGALPSEFNDTVTTGVTGEPALRSEELQSVLSTIGISMALSLVAVAVILRIGLGSTLRAGIAFTSLLVSLVLTTGFAGIAIGNLNLVSVAFIVLMVGLGIDFAIHILAHMAEMRRHGTAPDEAVALTGRRTGLALCLSAVTTSVAFLAFATTDFDGMAQLGLLGGVGVLIAFAVAATLIPAATALAPSLAGDAVEPKAPRSATALSFFAPIVVLSLGTIAILPALDARFDADPMALRDPNASSVRAFEVLAANPETTPYRVSIVTASAPDAINAAAAFENAVGIGAALTIADLVPQQQDDKLSLLDIGALSIEHAIYGAPDRLLSNAPSAKPLSDLAEALKGQPDAAGELVKAIETYLDVRSPETDALLTASLYRTFPLMLGRLEAMLRADYIDTSKLPPTLRERFVTTEGLYRVEILPENNLQTPEDIALFAKTVTDIDARAAGGPVQLAAAGNTVGGAMLKATLLAAIATFVLAYLTTRRVSDTAAILSPLLIAGVITAAASVLLDMPFNYANVIVLPLLIGIGVDSGVHIALRERRAPGAVYATSTPRAVLFSALTTMAAFGTLALSEHRGTASMGVLLAISMTAAVGCVLALTPALIRWTRAEGVR